MQNNENEVFLILFIWVYSLSFFFCVIFGTHNNEKANEAYY